MIKKTVTYTDFLGTTRKVDLYFHLSKSELSAMQMSVDGGYNVQLQKILDAKNNKEIYNNFVKVVLESYGELTPDGVYHIKEDDEGHKLYKKFQQSPMYDALMDDICQNETTIAEFLNGIMPKQIVEQQKPNGEFHPNK